jgi:hypothetical protein
VTRVRGHITVVTAIASAVAAIGTFIAVSQAPAVAVSAPPPATAVRQAAKVEPARIVISRIGVDATVGSVGLRASGEIEVPPLSVSDLAGWYRFGPVPGETGPAVIVGHSSTRSGPAVFARLRELHRDDTIRVLLSDGSAVVFTVDGAEQVAKTRFPTARVYGNIASPGLRLITCAGIYDRKTHGYKDNLVVYATMRPVGSV